MNSTARSNLYRRVQRDHQFAHAPPTTRLIGDQALQLGNRFGVIAKLQQPPESLLGGDQTELLALVRAPTGAHSAERRKDVQPGLMPPSADGCER